MTESPSPEQLFADHLELIDRIIASICRRKACFGDDAEEFGQWARLKMIEDDYRALRRFKGRSKLSTYLNTVIHNLFRDWRIARWGRWRPSAAARRMGPAGVRLETLLARDGFELGEAIEILRSHHDEGLSVAELEGMAARLPQRVVRRFEGEETLARLGTEDGGERRVRDAELAALAGRLDEALGHAFESLDGEDRLLMKLRFEDGFTVREIARTLGRRARPLYSRYERCLRALRSTLEAHGLSAGEIRGLLEWERRSVRVDYKLPEAESRSKGPSKWVGRGP